MLDRLSQFEVNVLQNVAFPCCNTDSLPTQDARAANLTMGVGQEERFFNKLEDDVSHIIQQEKRRKQYSNCQAPEINTSTEHEPVSRKKEMHILFIQHSDVVQISTVHEEILPVLSFFLLHLHHYWQEGLLM